MAGPPKGSGGTPAEPEDCATDRSADVGPSPLRRLTRQQYARTLQQLLQLDEPPAVDGIPSEVERDGFAVHSDLQTVSAQHLRAYLQMATEQADRLLADPARVERVIRCDINSPECLHRFAARFTRLAFRRPVADGETERLLSAATADALDVEDRFRYVIEAVLVSPDFLYRVELGPEPMLAKTFPNKTFPWLCPKATRSPFKT